MTRSTPRRRWPWLLVALVLIAILLQLGNWQVRRLAWKRDLIARVEARAHAAPVAAPEARDWPRVTRAHHEYQRVALSGRFLHHLEARVQAVTELGAGYWVLTPLQRTDGSLVWVNRGFVPPALADPASRAPAGANQAAETSPGAILEAIFSTQHDDAEQSIMGLLRITEPGGAFLRQNDPTAQRWYSRDVTALSAAHGLPLERTAPYFVDAQPNPATDPASFIAPAAPTVWPRPGLTVLHFANNHLVYALTWYGLALGLLLALILVWRSERRKG